VSESSQRLLSAGRAAFPGFELCRVDRTPSTQDVVRTAAHAGAAEGLCCVATEQTAGRGRQRRQWHAPRGSALLCSILLRWRPEDAGGIPIAAGIAVTDAVAAVCGVIPGLKWPNDVLVDGAKLAGILVEAESQPAPAVIVGIGINITVAEFPEGVLGTSLHRLTPTPPDADAVLAALMPALRKRLDELRDGGVVALRSAWRERAVGLGGPVRATLGSGVITGTAVDIDDDGALLVTTADGVARVIAAEVHIGT